LLDNLFVCIIYLLAAYGALVLVLGAIDTIRGKKAAGHPKVRVVLLVQNAQEQIEFIVRNVIRKDFASSASSDKKVIFVDMDSSDETVVLLRKLQQCYPAIEVLQHQDKEVIFNDFQLFSPNLK